MNQMQTGARTGKSNWLRRLIARATAQTLQAFVIPDLEMARRYGIDLEAAGLNVVVTPRYANVLLLIGDIPPGLANAAAVVYSQMLRPRIILAIGSQTLPPPLSAPDVQADFDLAQISAAIGQVRRLFVEKVWLGEGITDFAGPTDSSPETEATDDHAHMHHGGMSATMDHTMPMEEMPPEGHAMSQTDKAGMNHSDQPMSMPEMEQMEPSDSPMSHPDRDQMEHDSHDMSDKMAMNSQDMSGMDMSGHNMNQMDMGGMNHSGHDMGGMDMSGHDMGGMDMGGFMSMVAMTQDLPRSQDGLPMEWLETPFGPLFPGLRAGLALNFTLDGEEVALAKVTPGTLKRGLKESWPGSVASFPARLARLDPLAPASYRLLARQALEQAAGIKVDEAEATGRIGLLERERDLSHLGWLAKLAELLGDNWLARQTARLQLDLAKTQSVPEISRLRPSLLKLKDRWQKTPLLKTRLTKKGQLNQEDLEGVTGPVAKASEFASDARSDSPAYLRLGFKPEVREGGDALARLLVRLAELEQSLDLILTANSIAKLDAVALSYPFHDKVSSTSRLETPRGTATLSLTIEHGKVSEIKLETPSAALVKLVGKVSEGQDLADALVGVASLDLSPWELEP